MNKTKRLSIIAIAVLVATALQAQTHSFALWLSGGYNSHNTKITDYSYKGGAGGNIGLGYDLQAGNFVLQLGGEFAHLTSNIGTADFVDSIPMVNTEGTPYMGHFAFTKNRDMQQFGKALAQLKLGFVTTNTGTQFYGLFGGKIGFNLYGNTHTYTTVTSSGVYDDIIGGGDGDLSNMPNHDYYTGNREYKEEIALAPTIYGSAELGLQFMDAKILGATPRLALFFDYGFTSLANKPENVSTERIINISETDQFKPALRPMFYNDQTDKFNTFFTGIKLTLLWGGDNTSYCHCIDDHKVKLTKGRSGKAASSTPKRYKKKVRRPRR